MIIIISPCYHHYPHYHGYHKGPKCNVPPSTGRHRATATMLRGCPPSSISPSLLHQLTSFSLDKHQADSRKQVARPDKDGFVRLRPKYGGHARNILGSGPRYARHHLDQHYLDYHYLDHYYLDSADVNGSITW